MRHNEIILDNGNRFTGTATEHAGDIMTLTS